MVEGPGCTRNGQKVRATLLGKKVSGVAGSASSTVANAIRGRTLVDAITLGKQLWLIFAGTEATHDEHAVRCHFGMNGSLHCNSKQPPAHAGPLSLLIKFADGGEARLLQATVTLADAQAARRAVSEACDRDVCSAAFDEAAALAALAAVPADWMACDALLDQARHPYTSHTSHTSHTPHIHLTHHTHFTHTHTNLTPLTLPHPSHPSHTPHASRLCCRAWATSSRTRRCTRSASTLAVRWAHSPPSCCRGSCVPFAPSRWRGVVRDAPPPARCATGR